MPSPLPILTTASFTGEWFIPFNETASDPATHTQSKAAMTACIAEWEPKYLRRMMGKDLYDSYISNSSASRFTVITAAFAEQDSANDFHESDGIAAMLKGFIYFEFLRVQAARVTPNGVVKPASETSEAAPPSVRIGMLMQKFNKAVDTYRQIQWYMSESDFSDDYPEFSGVDQPKMFFV